MTARRATRLFYLLATILLCAFYSARVRAAEPGGFGHPYVRFDFGYAIDHAVSFAQDELIDAGGRFVSEDIGRAPYLGLGIGWRLSDQLRLDVTAERRFDADVTASDFVQRRLTGPDGLMTGTTTYSGSYSAWVGLVNAYMDLPKWDLVTPYIGAGIGLAHNRFSDIATDSSGRFRDDATGDVITQNSNGKAGHHSENRFAWALMAGLSVSVDPQAKLDLGYRYLDLGSDVSASTGLIECVCGVVGSPLEANDLSVHELRIGLRWEFSPLE